MQHQAVFLVVLVTTHSKRGPGRGTKSAFPQRNAIKPTIRLDWPILFVSTIERQWGRLVGLSVVRPDQGFFFSSTTLYSIDFIIRCDACLKLIGAVEFMFLILSVTQRHPRVVGPGDSQFVNVRRELFPLEPPNCTIRSPESGRFTRKRREEKRRMGTWNRQSESCRQDLKMMNIH